MDTEKRAVVLACVTMQFECDRIIKVAKQIADDTDCELRVLSVLEPTHDYTEAAYQIEYLNLVSKKFGADMTVLFDKNPDCAAADFAEKCGAQRIVTGLHDGGEKSFLVGFNRLKPEIPLTMVAKDNMVYSMDVCKVCS
nr:MAG TPA: hypothetical protein [Caudoviricetes sp.]